jgi:hypothetical protein
MSNAYRDKLLSIGYLKGGRTGPKVVEGDRHPESGLRYKSTTDELNNTVTEHTAPNSGVSVRQDVHLRPKSIKIGG